MPYINGPSNQYFLDQLAMMRRQIREIATQQNWGITDGNLKMRIRGGLQPDGTYGIWMLDPTTGNPVAKMTGTAFELLTAAGAKLIDLTDGGLALYDSAGHLLVDLTDTGLSVYDATGHKLVQLDASGQTVYDTSGNVRTELGLLSNGDYGLLVADPTTGQKTEILPVYEAGTTSQISPGTTAGYTSTSGPAVTAVIGASGQALLTVNSYVGVPGIAAAQSAGYVGISIDGGTPSGSLNELIYFSTGSTPTAAVPIAASQSSQIVVSGLSAGKHSFRMEYKTTGPTVNFRERFLQVRPL